jgi:hypothetical protein
MTWVKYDIYIPYLCQCGFIGGCADFLEVILEIKVKLPRKKAKPPRKKSKTS